MPAQAALPAYDWASSGVHKVTPEIERRYTREYLDCIRKGPKTTFNATDCSGEEAVAQDVQLNLVWKRTVVRLGPSRMVELRGSERAWIGAIDKYCDQGVVPNATFGRAVVNEWYITETIRRTIWLEHLR